MEIEDILKAISRDGLIAFVGSLALPEYIYWVWRIKPRKMMSFEGNNRNIQNTHKNGKANPAQSNLKELRMKICVAILYVMVVTASQIHCAETKWYIGDERCPPPKDDGKYSAPYNVLDYPQDYPTFPGADKHGWSCSYSKEDGVIVQYGDSRTPQQQWLAIFGDNDVQ